MIDYLDVLRYLHVICFVYWLGGDLGVFLAARYAADPQLEPTSRRRFFRYLLALDIAPRLALVGILWLGLEMSFSFGYLAAPAIVRILLAVVFAAWLAMVWTQHMRVLAGKPSNEVLKVLDLALRGISGLGLLFFAAAIWSGWIAAPGWLAAKAVVFAAIFVIGRILNTTIGGWVQGMAVLETDPPRANALIGEAHGFGAKVALTLWAAVALAGFLGVAQP